MKYLLLTLFTFIFFNAALTAQNTAINKAANAYNDLRYQDVLDILINQTDVEARLFKGKAHFALGQLLAAKIELSNIQKNDNSRIYYEARYTLALVYINLNQPQFAINLIHSLQEDTRVPADIISDSKVLYQKLMGFLSLDQRLDLIRSTASASLIRDVIVNGITIENRANAQILWEIGKNLEIANHLNLNIKSHEALANLRPSVSQKTVWPDNLIYHFAVVLPHNETSVYSGVTESLFLGMNLAATKFNIENDTRTLFLDYLNNATDTTLTQTLSQVLSGSYHGLIGPLTGKNAKIFAPYSEDFHFPIFTPLANNDSIDVTNPYFFQLNPDMIPRGEKLAHFARKQLRFNTVAIMVEKNSDGVLAANQFRKVFEELGGTVRYMVNEDFKKNGYDVSKFTDLFTNDLVLRDSLAIDSVDAIYLPFTGESAPSVIELVLTDLEAYKSNVTILGSQEWLYAELPPERIRKFDIYYTDLYYPDESSEEVILFREEFLERTGKEADILSFLGYDILNYLIEALKFDPNPSVLKSSIKNIPRYQGLGNRFYFNRHNVNQSVEIYKLTTDQPVLVH